jgi:hypothetical protein
MTSTIPAAIDALLAMARARPELALPVEVWDGYPRREITNDLDLVAFGGQAEPVADGTQEAVTLGNRRRRETYSVRVYCSSSRGGDDQKATRDRAFALMAAVEAGVRANPSLGLQNVTAQVGGRVALFQTSDETAHLGSDAEVSFDISIEARI